MTSELKRNVMEYLCQAHMNGQHYTGCTHASYGDARGGVKEEYENLIIEIDKVISPTPDFTKAIEEKLQETTNYLVTISKRLTGDFPYGMGTECYFISEDVKDALDNIGGELAETFAEEIKKAELQQKLSKRKDIKEVTKAIEELIEGVNYIKGKGNQLNPDGVISDLYKILSLLWEVDDAIK